MNSQSGVECSLSVFEDVNLKNIYKPEELIYIFDKIITKAKELEIDISDFKINLKKEIKKEGKESMDIKELMATKEFQEAVEAEVKKKTESGEQTNKIKNLEASIKAHESTIAELKNQIVTLTTERDKAKADFDSYKGDIEANKIVETRFGELVGLGFKFEKTAEKVKASLKKMNDEEYTLYKDSLIEAKASVTPAKPDPKNPPLTKASKEDAVINPTENGDGETKFSKLGKSLKEMNASKLRL